MKKTHLAAGALAAALLGSLAWAGGADYQEMDVATMARLVNGAQVLGNRNIYTGGNADADLLKKLNGGRFKAWGILRSTESPGKFFVRVSVTLSDRTGAPAVVLAQGEFFSRKRAGAYLSELTRNFPNNDLVLVYFRLNYNFREVDNQLFQVTDIESPGGTDWTPYRGTDNFTDWTPKL